MKAFLKKIVTHPQLQLGLLFAVTILIFWPTFWGQAIFDDNYYIFKSELFASAQSFLDFWDRSNPRFRAWPLSYSVLWIVFQFAGDNFWVYKLLNLLIHFFNSLLVLSIAKKLITPEKSFLVALLFLAHPMQVETISWIFQLNTLLATAFFLLSFQFFMRWHAKENLLLLVISIYCFYLSTHAKPVAIAAPFLFLTLTLWAGGLRLSSKPVWLLPFFIISILVGTETLKGVTFSNPAESLAVSKYVNNQEPRTSDLVDIKQIIESPPQSTAPVDTASITAPAPAPAPGENIQQETSFATNISEREQEESQQKITDQAPDDSNLSLDSLNLNNSPLFSFSFYIINFLAPLKPNLIYGRFSLATQLLFTILGLSILVLSIILAKKSRLFWSSFLSYILAIFPISGFFYVPYMKFSFVADHWAYLAIIPMSLILVELISRYRQGTVLLALSILIYSYQSYSYTKIFSSQVLLLERSLTSAPDELTLYIELSNEYLKSNELKKAARLLEQGLQTSELANNPFLLMQMGYVYRKMDDRPRLRQTLTVLLEIFEAQGRTDLVEGMKMEIQSLTP